MSVVSGSFRARVRSSIEAPVARFFGRLGFSPNALTLIGFAIAVVGGVLVAAEQWVAAGIVVAVGAVFDLFDGALARATGRTSRLGAFLDSVFDRAGEALIYIGFVFAFIRSETGAGLALAALAMAAAFMVSYTRAKSEGLGFSSGSGMASIGLAPREIRTAILVLGLLGAPLAGSGTGFDDATPLAPLIALGLIAGLATITTIQRIYFVYQQSKSEPNNAKENH